MTPNDIANAVAVIGAHLGIPTRAGVAEQVLHVRYETLGNWIKGVTTPPVTAQAIMRLLVQSIEQPEQKIDTAVIVAALRGNNE